MFDVTSSQSGELSIMGSAPDFMSKSQHNKMLICILLWRIMIIWNAQDIKHHYSPPNIDSNNLAQYFWGVESWTEWLEWMNECFILLSYNGYFYKCYTKYLT